MKQHAGNQEGPLASSCDAVLMRRLVKPPEVARQSFHYANSVQQASPFVADSGLEPERLNGCRESGHCSA